MSEKPEAQRLAEHLEAIGLRGPVAAELRRLHEENGRLRIVAEMSTLLLDQRSALLEALRWTARALDHDHPAAVKARAAIAKVEGENT